MDGIITTVLAGVIVALIGAYAGRDYERQRDAEKQLEERRREEQEEQQEIQKELNKLGADRLDQMRPQILSVVGAFVDWLEALSEYENEVSGEKEDGYYLSRAILRRLREKADSYVERGSVVSHKMSTLRLYYWERKPALSKRARVLFDSFDNEFQQHHAALLNTTKAVVPDIKWLTRYSWLPAGNFAAMPSWLLALRNEEFIEPLRDRADEWSAAIKSAQDWDIRHYVDAFDAEVERLRRNA
jgi:hypothetical protein